jgi:hypothetical protein
MILIPGQRRLRGGRDAQHVGPCRPRPCPGLTSRRDTEALRASQQPMHAYACFEPRRRCWPDTRLLPSRERGTLLDTRSAPAVDEERARGSTARGLLLPPGMRACARVLRLSRAERVALARPRTCSSRSGTTGSASLIACAVSSSSRPNGQRSHDSSGTERRTEGQSNVAIQQVLRAATCGAITSVQPGLTSGENIGRGRRRRFGECPSGQSLGPTCA